MNYSTLAILGIFVISVFSITSLAHAETAAKSTSFEKTTLIEFTNNESTDIQTVRMWLGKDSGEFKSFKAEKGWTGTKTAQGVLIFSTIDSLSPGQSVKFGIKTEVAGPGINWKTVDSAGADLSVGKTLPGQTIQQPKETTPPQDNTPPPATMDKATFKIIPESPKNGDSIRIVGEGFPPNTVLNFMIDNESLEDFQSDEKGNVIGTAKIPLTKQADRVDLSLADKTGNRKTISIRIGHADVVVSPPSHNIEKLTVDKGTEIAEPGQKVSASGTGKAGGSVKITAKDSVGTKLYEAVVQIDSQGNWSHETTVPLDAPLGTRTIEFSDGVDTITKTLSISVSKTVRISSSAIKYNPGDKLLFNGTAKPDQSLQIIIDDPIGKEVYSDIIQVNATGLVSFGYQTTSASIKGTYAMLASQGDETEIVRVGLGELPTEQIIAKFDKLNYASSETAKLTIEGPTKSTISLLVIDPSDKVKITEGVTLGLDGSKVYELGLSGYKSGVYTVVLKYTKSQAEVVFSVGLQTTSGPIIMHATKETYLPGEISLVLGSTNANALLSLEMSDPNGKIIKQKDIFSDKDGKFSDGTFRVPSDAVQGAWMIKAKSGANYAEAKFTVSGTTDKTFTVKVDKQSYIKGDLMIISGTGGGKTQTATATISDQNGVKITDLSSFSTSAGSFQITWKVPTDMVPGTYKIKATIGTDVAETTFTVQ